MSMRHHRTHTPPHLLRDNLRRSYASMRASMARSLYRRHCMSSIEVIDDRGNGFVTTENVSTTIASLPLPLFPRNISG
jgi:hypothetical protein